MLLGVGPARHDHSVGAHRVCERDPAVSRLEPWIIEQLEEEERRRQEEEAQRSRIELPQTAPAHEERERTGVTSRLQIVPLSPPVERVDGNVIDV